MTGNRLELVRQQIQFSREYTLSLLADIDDDDWFRQPQEGVTHVAWQVGHLAMAQYGLGLFRMRGRRAEDAALMSGSFRKKFSKGSLPDPAAENNPSPAEIRDVKDVHGGRGGTAPAGPPAEISRCHRRQSMGYRLVAIDPFGLGDVQVDLL